MKKFIVVMVLAVFALPAFSMTALNEMTKLQSDYCNAKWAYFLSPTPQNFKVYYGYRKSFTTKSNKLADRAMEILKRNPDLKGIVPMMNTRSWYYTQAMSTFTQQCPDNMRQ